MKSTIIWKTVKHLMQSTFAPVDWPEDPDHQPRWVMVNGVPDLCCDRHRLYPHGAHHDFTARRADPR
jgi:hypothetical protein